ncbi:AMP-binding protein [Micromonospora sp. CPCC 206060]|uniref:AMP-binding protein n=1 Tax=Micromonospora sp. CPCC 206060 TaxID=3122406 RepID=UPI002FF2B0C8
MASPIDLLPDLRTVPLARDLADHGDRPALLTVDGEISYRELAARVAATARRLGTRRRLVLLTTGNTVDAVVGYLAALAGGHPVLLAPAEHTDTLVDAYDPDVVLGPGRQGTPQVHERRDGSTHDLHPDLALLLSTSGTTGSPKLVRLSHTNVQANAEAIATYLDIQDTDRAATTLPMHYCYGLSVINSHLLRGAALILTDLSVADTCFWDLLRARGGTTFAAVPYTFDLLDRVGFAGMDLPRLRYVTCAGGRLAPDRVVRWADRGRRAGWQLVVMYGQTEATARMAYLPPELAATRPGSIGVPVPGGSFRIEPVDGQPDGTGELVYTGPNVMLGYAHHPADLRLGRRVAELRTGDLARRGDDGLYELVGRRSRFAKICGLRVDPQRVETVLETHGIRAACLGDDDTLIVAVPAGTDGTRVRRLVRRECGLPGRAVRVLVLDTLPRLATGKLDYPAVRQAAAQQPDSAGTETDGGAGGGPVDLCRLYAEVLDRDGVTEQDSFVSLDGDSLSYVEMSVRLEQALGHLPAGWHTRAIRDLHPSRQPSRRRWRALETSVAVRAAAIVLIVGSHLPVFHLKGGAHLLLAVAGFNFARFQLTGADRRHRNRHLWGSIGRVAVPSIIWIALAWALTDDYRLSNILLLNAVLGPHDGRSEWHFWFVEALVYILLALAALTALPWVDRAERRWPFGLPVALLVVGLIGRYELFGLAAYPDLPSAVVVFWLFALGWAAARATGVAQRVAVTVVALATVPGFFGELGRELLIVAGFALLVWVPHVPGTALLNRVAALLAGSSLYIYLSHWQVYPRLDDVPRWLVLVACLVVGIGVARVAEWISGRITAVRRSTGRRTVPAGWFSQGRGTIRPGSPTAAGGRPRQ